VQLLAPGPDICPALQALQALSPGSAEALPDRQGEQIEDPIAA
jgi:hypothetical protein